jgi:hypothetical protein
LTGSVGGQTAADPDHRTADCAANSPLRLTAGCDESLPADRLTLFAPALPFDLNVVGMDQHLRNHLLSNWFSFARRPAGLCYALRVARREARPTPRRLCFVCAGRPAGRCYALRDLRREPRLISLRLSCFFFARRAD